MKIRLAELESRPAQGGRSALTPAGCYFCEGSHARHYCEFVTAAVNEGLVRWSPDGRRLLRMDGTELPRAHGGQITLFPGLRERATAPHPVRSTSVSTPTTLPVRHVSVVIEDQKEGMYVATLEEEEYDDEAQRELAASLIMSGQIEEALEKLNALAGKRGPSPGGETAAKRTKTDKVAPIVNPANEASRPQQVVNAFGSKQEAVLRTKKDVLDAKTSISVKDSTQASPDLARELVQDLKFKKRDVPETLPVNHSEIARVRSDPLHGPVEGPVATFDNFYYPTAKLPVSLNGVDYEAILDGGSYLCVISERVFNELKPPSSLLKNCAMTGVFGESRPIERLTKLKVRVGMVEAEVPFVVYPDSNFDVLLGQPFRRITRIIEQVQDNDQTAITIHCPKTGKACNLITWIKNVSTRGRSTVKPRWTCRTLTPPTLEFITWHQLDPDPNSAAHHAVR
jgi:hypothetical protein